MIRWLEEERDAQVVYRLHKLTVKKTKDGDISLALAWDDLTGMSLDAG